MKYSDVLNFVCRKHWRSFRRVRWKTSTVSSTNTSNSAPWFTCAALKSKNCRSSCASHRGKTTPAQAYRRPLRYPRAGPPFRLMQPPCRHIHPNQQSPGERRPDSRTRPRTRRSERRTDGHSIQTARCRCRSCNSNNQTASDYWVYGLASVHRAAAVNVNDWT